MRISSPRPRNTSGCAPSRVPSARPMQRPSRRRRRRSPSRECNLPRGSRHELSREGPDRRGARGIRRLPRRGCLQARQRRPADDRRDLAATRLKTPWRPRAAVALRVQACETRSQAYPFTGNQDPGVAAMHRRRFIASTLAAGAAVVTRTARAAAYPDPSRTIRLVVPVEAGGGVDVLARLYAEALKEKHGLTVIVENRGGASGTIGGELVHKAAPDGYTLLFSAP